MKWQIKNIEVRKEIESNDAKIPKKLKLLASLSLIIGQPIAITVAPGMLLSIISIFTGKENLPFDISFYGLCILVFAVLISYLYTLIDRIRNKIIDLHLILMILGLSISFLGLGIVYY